MAVDMYCLRPIEIRVKTKSGLDTGKRRVVPCGKCPACLKNYQHQWIVRLKEELKHSQAAFFVTLTYEDDSKGFQKKECQRFLDRLQHKCKYNGVRMKYFLISEYGHNTGRAHHHAQLFLDKFLDGFPEMIVKSWKLGFVQVGSCTGASIVYCTKYVLKDWPNDLDWSEHPDHLNPNKCRLISKKIGFDFITPEMRKYYQDMMSIHYVDNGVMSQMPRYYVDKIFTDDQVKEIKLLNRCYAEKQEQLKNSRLGLTMCIDKEGHKIRDPRNNKILYTFKDDEDGSQLRRYIKMQHDKLQASISLWSKRKKQNSL